MCAMVRAGTERHLFVAPRGVALRSPAGSSTAAEKMRARTPEASTCRHKDR